MSSIEKAGQKITMALLATQSLFSASTIIIFTVSSIIAVELAGSERWTGVPSTLVLVGAAMSAYPVGRLMDRVGRRIGLSLGYVTGIGGAGLAGLAVMWQSLPLFLLGVLMIGLTKGINDLGRYAAAEANLPRRQARAISLVVLGGTVGSIVGPVLIRWASSLAEQAGLPPLSGTWFTAGLLLTLALLIVNLFLRPDPLAIARELRQLEPAPVGGQEGGRSFQEVWRDPRTKLAIGAMVVGQLVMVLLMTGTPVYMHKHDHQISAISWVIMAHTMGMFGLSFGVGWLVDRLGRAPMIVVGSLILISACLVAPLSTRLPWLALALFLLGLGWNCCFVAGSTLLTDVLRADEKGRIQGLTDTMVSIASGTGSLSSGLVGFVAMTWVGLLLALIPAGLVILLRVLRRQAAASLPHAAG